jgi:tetratricopeptide (TPR) repeat protein
MSRAGRVVRVGIAPALILGGAVLAASLFADGKTTAGPAPYPFRCAKAGSSEKEIAFLEERVRRNPDDGLDLAALAAATAARARKSGHGDEYARAERLAMRSLEKLPFHNEGASLVLARVAEARHDFARALELASDVLKRRPRAVDARALRVTSNLALGRPEEAMKDADDLVEFAPRQAGYSLRALALAATGREREAIRDFEKAIALEDVGENDESARTRALLARLHLRRGRYGPARALLEESLRIVPGSPLALGLLGDLHAAQEEWSRAERYYALASVDSHDPMHLVRLARAREAQGDRRTAEAIYRDAEEQIRAELAGAGGGHRLVLVRLLLQRGRAEDVREAVELARAETQVRRSAEALDGLAWALSRAGRWREARRAIREALRVGAGDPALYDRASQIERALGEVDSARFYGSLSTPQ